jgi:DNA-binding LacI/PurR family transcriptional regulator
LEGCKKALRENNLSDEALRMITCDETIDSCYRVVRDLLKENGKTDALYVWDDRLAVGAIKAVYEAGRRIPRDMGIIGYDDIEIAEYLYPSLSTIRQLTFEIGDTAAHILLEKLELKTNALKQIILKPELVVRKTT